MANYWSKYMADKGEFAHVINGKNAAEVFSGGMRSEENIAFVPLTTKSTYTTKDARKWQMSYLQFGRSLISIMKIC